MKLATLLLLHLRGKISRKTFLMLRLKIKKRKKRNVEEEEEEWSEEQFNLANYSSKECRKLFRFSKAELLRLSRAFRIPKVVQTAARDRAADMEALCIVLRRLAYPNRWIELRRMFGRSHSSLHRIFYKTLRLIDRRSSILTSWDSSWLDEESFERYADVIMLTGGNIPNVVAFIDGTARPIARPKFHQKEMYSGHKRIHCTKWQGVTLPNGLFGNLYGGERGTMHDSRLLTDSGFLESFRAHQDNFAQQYALYGNSGYGKRHLLHKPFCFDE